MLCWLAECFDVKNIQHIVLNYFNILFLAKATGGQMFCVCKNNHNDKNVVHNVHDLCDVDNDLGLGTECGINF